MSTKICINLPVKDLGRSADFFSRLGFRRNPQLSGDSMDCLVISDDI
jgi:predicted lactoylglutathione lyase